MDSTSLILGYMWTVFYIVSVLVFFGIAVWVIIRGASDMRDLLSGTEDGDS